jgi:hypothetical protein
MSTKDLDNVKAEVQKILDKHLEENQRFSIQDLDEESTFLLIDLLLEKDEEKREQIRTKIQKKIKTNKMNIELDYENIMEIKDKLDYLKNDSNDLNNLKNTVNADSELDNQLNNI